MYSSFATTAAEKEVYSRLTVATLSHPTFGADDVGYNSGNLLIGLFFMHSWDVRVFGYYLMLLIFVLFSFFDHGHTQVLSSHHDQCRRHTEA